MRVLGAILAGGQSRRFGSDKAAAMLGADSLIDHAIRAVRAQTDEMVLCGRAHPGIASLADRPAADMGPLGGLNAALHYAARTGFDAVLCVPVDVHPLPANLRELLGGSGAKAFDVQHSVGFWPVRYASSLDRHLAGGNSSFRSWIGSSQAAVVSDQILALENVNTSDDLNKLIQRNSASPFPCDRL